MQVDTVAFNSWMYAALYSCSHHCLDIVTIFASTETDRMDGHASVIPPLIKNRIYIRFFRRNMLKYTIRLMGLNCESWIIVYVVWRPVLIVIGAILVAPLL